MFLYQQPIENNNDYCYKVVPKKFYPMIVDKVFHYLVNNSNKKENTSLIISEVLGIDYEYVLENIKFVNNRLDLDKINEAEKNVDCLCVVGEFLILIEMNRQGDKSRLIRNIEYLFKVFTNFRKSGEGYKFKKIRLINIDNYNFKGVKKEVTKYRLSNVDENSHYFLTDICEIYHVFLPNIREKSYTNCKLNKLERLMIVMNEEDDLKVEKVIEGDEIMRKCREDLKKFNDDNLITLEEHEEIERHYMRDKEESFKEEGRKEGIKQSNLSIAKNMLDRKYSIAAIHELTGLSNKEIESIK